MQTILVANSKGGAGKTTLATNVAGWLAGKRQAVALADLDPQRSATEWLARRPALFPPIARWEAEGRSTEGEKRPAWLVVDSPAAVGGEDLKDVLRRASLVLVPIVPSAFDMAATERFLGALCELRTVKRRAIPIGIVTMRVDARTHSAAELDVFLKTLDLPVVGHLRDTQVYVACARDGASVFDLPRSRAEQDWDQWRPVVRWIARQVARRDPAREAKAA